MVDFRIDVVVDPRQAKAGAKQVGRALDSVEKEAADLRQELQSALSVRSSGTTAALNKINQSADRARKTTQGLTSDQQRVVANIRRQQGIEQQRLRLSRAAARERVQNERNVARAAVKSQQRIQAELTKTGKVAGRTGGLLKRAFAGLGIALLTRSFIQQADSLTNVQNRLRLVTKDSRELAEVQALLFEASNNTRSSFTSTSEVFNRLAVSSEELGITNKELVQITQSLNQAVILSGASATEAQAGLIQLSQGLAAGALRGDELNSVLEQLPAVAAVISKSLGVTTGQLRKLGAQGLITSDIVIKAFREARVELNERFATTVPTVAQSFTVLGNKITESIGSLNEAIGITTGLSVVIIFLSENLPLLTDAVIALSTVLLIRYAQRAIPAAIAGTKGLTLATIAGTAAFAAAAAGLFLLNKRLRERIANEKEIGEILNRIEEDSAAVSGTAQLLTAAQRELNNINRLVKEGVVGLNGEILRQNKLSESQIARTKTLEATIARLRGTLVITTKAQQAQSKVLTEAKKVEDERIESLKRQESLLKALKQPEIDRVTRIKDLQALIAKGGDSVALLSAELDKLQEKQTKATTVKADRPSSTFAEELAALDKQNDALAIRTMRQNEFTAAKLAEAAIVDKIKREITDPERAALIERFQKQQQINEAARERAAIEQVVNNLGAQQAEQAILLSDKSIDRMNAELIALQLKQRGITLTEEQIAALERENGKIRMGNEELAKRTRLAGLAEELDLGAQIALQRQDLIDLRQQEADLIPEIDRALEDLRLRELEASNELSAGFERAFIKIKREAEDLAAVGESIVNVFADRATDAIVEFARTGRFSFKEFANAILDDLIRIIARLLIVQAIQAATGLGGAGNVVAGAATNAGAQFGGTVQPGQAPRPVGENGPELFVPNRTGTIVPNPADVQQPAPIVNVQLVTVENEDMVAEAIASGSADEAIIQRIGANRDRVDAAQG